MASRRLAALSLIAAVSLGGQALAHHSSSMFDRTKPTMIKGTIKSFEWSNPHSWAYIMVPRTDGSGAVDEWRIEGGSPNILARQDERWGHDTLKPGDMVTLTIFPERSGKLMGTLQGVTFASGEYLKGGGL
jgi:hypothetical protein